MSRIRSIVYFGVVAVTASQSSAFTSGQETADASRASVSETDRAERSAANSKQSADLQQESSEASKKLQPKVPSKRTPPPKPEPLNGTNFVDDVQITKYAEYQVNRLIKDGDAWTCSELASQYEDATCDVALVAPREKTCSATELYQQATKSVVAILISRKHLDHWHVVLAATGFFVSDAGVIATNHHVFKKSEEYMFVMTSDYVVHPIRQVLGGNASSDVAFCQIQSKAYRGLPLQNDAPIGSDVTLISHPAGRYFFFSRGTLARRYVRPPQRRSGSREAESEDLPQPSRRSSRWLTVTAEFGKGSSGGPVFDRFGNVIGMATSTNSLRVGEKNEQVAQMNFRDCVPAEALLESLQDESGGSESGTNSAD